MTATVIELTAGSKRKIEIHVTDQESTLPTDAFRVNVYVADPDGAVTSYQYTDDGDHDDEVTHLDDGEYVFEFLPPYAYSSEGEWTVAVQALQDDSTSVEVVSQKFYVPPLATLV